MLAMARMLATLKMTSTNKLPKRLKDLRTRAAVSCREAARLAGLTEGHVSQIERRNPRIEADTLASLARVFGVSLDWLYAGEGRAPSDAALQAAVAAATRRADRTSNLPAKRKSNDLHGA